MMISNFNYSIIKVKFEIMSGVNKFNRDLSKINETSEENLLSGH